MRLYQDRCSYPIIRITRPISIIEIVPVGVAELAFGEVLGNDDVIGMLPLKGLIVREAVHDGSIGCKCDWRVGVMIIVQEQRLLIMHGKMGFI